MSSSIICKDASICYLVGDLKSIGLKEYIVRHLPGNYHVRQFWANRHISFSLDKGDMLGIVGANGAGKSTLLKAVAHIMIPTEGEIRTSGKVAALLELTSGFDNQMTVRENTFLRGALLGYSKKFLESRYREIIEFAELQEFEDYQFKQLSSGMKSRLAFSIACMVRPDILILDEVLSVGDGAFREKSERKMKEILSGGITGILVSHTIQQIRDVCNKILWLDHGNQIVFSDQVSEICDAYEEFLHTGNLPDSDPEIHQLAAAFRERILKKGMRHA
jgi:ABC-2 type transport system ATP-binding protein